MFSAFVVTFRESLEAALVVGIILAYLNKSGNPKFEKSVWHGVALGVVASIALAVVFNVYLGGFEGRAEEIYEGIMYLTAALLITWMVVWMWRQGKNIKVNVEKKIAVHLDKNYTWGVMLLAFVTVLREGIETVIFMQAAFVKDNSLMVFLGGAVGVVGAVALGYAIFRGALKFPVRKFFMVTSILLAIFAVNLLINAAEEFGEAGVIPEIELF